MSNVIHGEGKPRIEIIEAAVLTGTISGVNSYTITLGGTPTLTDDVLNRKFRGKNALDEDTEGKIIAYSNDGHTITVDGFSNLFPENLTAYSILNFLIDLPYCQNNLIESFNPDFGPQKKLWNTGRKYQSLRGFYYRVILDYSRYFKKDDLILMQNVYSANRTGDLYVIPRRDNPDVKYLCNIDPEAGLEFAQLQRHQGHRMVMFSFRGLERLAEPPLTANLDNMLGASTIVMADDLVVDL
jgi:hypothetical protein